MGDQIWAKIGPKISFMSFFRVWFISFPGNIIGWYLGTFSNYYYRFTCTHQKMGPKLGPKLGFLPFSQNCIISFPSYCTRLQLGTMSNIYWSWNLKKIISTSKISTYRKNFLRHENIFQGLEKNLVEQEKLNFVPKDLVN